MDNMDEDDKIPKTKVINHTDTLLEKRPLKHDESLYPDSERNIEINHDNKRKKCNCKNSKCLKLYCECFAAKLYCDDCNCIGCLNTPDNNDIVQKAVSSTLERNPKAFRRKINFQESGDNTIGRHSKGCHCKKSNCLKGYCECFQAKIKCGENCRCIDCKNHDGSRYPGSVYTQRHTLSPPRKRIRPNSVPAQAMNKFKASPRSNTPDVSASPFNIVNLPSSMEPQYTFSNTPPSISNLPKPIHRPIVNRPINRQITNRTRHSPIKNIPNSNQNISRCVSAPPQQQDPKILNELVELLGNTVSLSPSGFGLSLAPPIQSPSASPALITPSPQIGNTPLVRPQPVSFTSPSPIERKNEIQVNPNQSPFQSSNKPNIGGGAFKRIDNNNNNTN